MTLTVSFNAATITQDIEQDANAYLINFTDNNITRRTPIIEFGDYDLVIDTDNTEIDILYIGESYLQIPIKAGAIYSIYLQYPAINQIYFVLFESVNFRPLEAGTVELYRRSLQTQALELNIRIQNSSNIISVFPLDQSFSDTLESVRRLLVNNYSGSFDAMNNYYYAQGFEAGTGVDLDKDYIKTDDATNWITAIFRTFQAFFDIKFGSVSIGAIIIIPVAITIVWFIMRLFRGGGTS